MDSLSAKLTDETELPATEVTLTPEEDGTLVTLVVVVVGILAAIIFLFSMGVFIDCRTQSDRNTITSTGKRKRIVGLKMPPLGRAHRLQRGCGGVGGSISSSQRREDSKYLATDMCPNGSSIQPAAAAIADLGIDVV